jgi:uncharacterized repeat protein (TIGR01451 family)
MTVNPSADVQVKQTVSEQSPQIGDTVTFTVTATNNGPSQATNIKISDAIPVGLSGATVTGGAYSNGVWTIPALNNGQTATLTITGEVTSTPLKNTATITKLDQYDWNLTNNSNTLTVPSGSTKADVQVWVYDMNGLSTWYYGSSPEYIVEIYNAGPDDASNVVVNVNLPSGLILNGYDPRTGGNVTVVGNTLTWYAGYLGSGEYTAMDLLARLNTTGIVTLSANVAADQYDPNLSNNSGYWNMTVNPSADVQVKQTVSEQSPQIGDTVTFTVTATNNGPSQATNIKISDAIPVGLSGATVTGGAYSNGVWTIPALSNGQTATLTITGEATSTPLKNTATITKLDQYDWNLTNNSQTLHVT